MNVATVQKATVDTVAKNTVKNTVSSQLDS